MKVSTNIRHYREKLGLSRKDLAREMDVDDTTVAAWECGRILPRAAKLPKLAALFHCTIDELFGEPDNKTPPAGPGAADEQEGG